MATSAARKTNRRKKTFREEVREQPKVFVYTFDDGHEIEITRVAYLRADVMEEILDGFEERRILPAIALVIGEESEEYEYLRKLPYIELVTFFREWNENSDDLLKKLQE